MQKDNLMILDHLNGYQKTAENHFNRYFLLKSMLITSLKCSGEKIDKARVSLQNAGLIDMTNTGLVSITERGKAFLFEQKQQQLISPHENGMDYLVRLFPLYLALKEICNFFMGLYHRFV